jgi:hypothetical protein
MNLKRDISSRLMPYTIFKRHSGEKFLDAPPKKEIKENFDQQGDHHTNSTGAVDHIHIPSWFQKWES